MLLQLLHHRTIYVFIECSRGIRNVMRMAYVTLDAFTRLYHNSRDVYKRQGIPILLITYLSQQISVYSIKGLLNANESYMRFCIELATLLIDLRKNKSNFFTRADLPEAVLFFQNKVFVSSLQTVVYDPRYPVSTKHIPLQLSLIHI